MRFLEKLLVEINRTKSGSFSGTGVVYYRQLEDLPHAQLGSNSPTKPTLPISGLSHISSVLAEASDITSLWHDGFHFIDALSDELTHLSQFLSPSLRHLQKDFGDQRPSGARQMAALLTSLTPGILSVGLISQHGGISIYTDGAVSEGVVH